MRCYKNLALLVLKLKVLTTQRFFLPRWRTVCNGGNGRFAPFQKWLVLEIPQYESPSQPFHELQPRVGDDPERVDKVIDAFTSKSSLAPLTLLRHKTFFIPWLRNQLISAPLLGWEQPAISFTFSHEKYLGLECMKAADFPTFLRTFDSKPSMF